MREHKRQGRHRLNEITGPGASKLGHAITPANWIAVRVPNTTTPECSPASAKPHQADKIPVHEKTEKSAIAINLAGINGLHTQIHWPTQEGSKLAEFIRELLT